MLPNKPEGETFIVKLLCPKGHNVTRADYPSTDFWCEHCMSEYDYAELQKVPLQNKSSYHPTVYGHPD